MRFKVINFVSDQGSWINSYLKEFIEKLFSYSDQVNWYHSCELLTTSDLTFYLSFSKIVPQSILAKSKHNLVVHESKLPQGKGWSPLTWQVLEGKNAIPITLFEADVKVDNGKIYLEDTIMLKGHELVEELRAKQADYTFKLCKNFIEHYEEVVKQAYDQTGETSFYPRRTPEDSRLDINKTLKDQINLFRVVDNEKYPAYFEYLGYVYELSIKKQS